MKKPPENLGAWEAYQQALWHWPKQSTNLLRARSLLQQAVSLDPRFAPAHAMLALLYLNETSLGTGLPMRESVKLAEAGARTALELDPESSTAHAVLAWAFASRGDRGPALEEAEAAITLNPNDPYGHLIKGRILVFSSQAGEAGEPLATALRLDPHGPTAPSVLLHCGVGSYFQQDYAAAAAMAGRAVRAYPDFPRPYPILAAALGQLGLAEQAHAALDAAIAASPSYFRAVTGNRMPYFRPDDHEHLLDGLRKAGWQG
jgi:adenylate cyclase